MVRAPHGRPCVGIWQLDSLPADQGLEAPWSAPTRLDADPYQAYPSDRPVPSLPLIGVPGPLDDGGACLQLQLFAPYVIRRGGRARLWGQISGAVRHCRHGRTRVGLSAAALRRMASTREREDAG